MSSIQAPAVSPYLSSLSPRPAAATSGTSSTTSSNSQTSLSSLGSTFLKLLTQELQNQDPTAPVDSTQMVGQMISLNQLDQLASINQTLTNQFPTAATATASSQTGATPGASQARITAAVQAAMQALNTASAVAKPNTQVSLPSF